MTAPADSGTEQLWAEEPSHLAGHARIRARIAGLHCSLCTGTIEKALGRQAGVDQVAVSLTHEQALVDYDPALIAPEDILATLRDIGYDHPVTLPFELRVENPAQPLSIGVSAFVGLCRNICIPFQADFALQLAGTGATPVQEAMLLASAEAKLPEAPSGDFALTHYALTGNDRLRLRLRLPGALAAPPQVIVTGPQGHVFFDSKDGRQDGEDYALEVPIEKLPKNYDMRGKRWGILVIAGDRAMETSLAFN